MTACELCAGLHPTSTHLPEAMREALAGPMPEHITVDVHQLRRLVKLLAAVCLY